MKRNISFLDKSPAIILLVFFAKGIGLHCVGRRNVVEARRMWAFLIWLRSNVKGHGGFYLMILSFFEVVSQFRLFIA